MPRANMLHTFFRHRLLNWGPFDNWLMKAQGEERATALAAMGL